MIENVGEGEDIASTRRVLMGLGVKISQLNESTWAVDGLGGIQGFTAPQERLDCGNSGTTMRLMAGLLSGCSFEVTLSGDHSLSRRPMNRIERVLKPLNRQLSTQERGGAPITIGGALSRSKILSSHDRDEIVVIDTQSSSAQLKSAALLAALSDPRRVEVREERLSRDHSERMLAALWGREPSLSIPSETPAIPPFHLISPGDFSSASFWIAIGALSPHNAPMIELKGINLNPSRLGFARIAERMGVQLDFRCEETRLGEPVGTLRVFPPAVGHELKAVNLSRQEIVDALDELPLVALLAAFAEGESIIKDAQELRVKESDRIEAMAQGLSQLGVHIHAQEDGWRIKGNPEHYITEHCTVDGYGDHRIAMCLMIAQLRQREDGVIKVEGSECLAISYPEFPTTFDAYRAEIPLA